MSILSMLALRMVTQVGLQGCLQLFQRVCEKNAVNNVNSEKCQGNLSKSSKRRLRKKKLKESSQQASPDTHFSVKTEEEFSKRENVDDRAYDLVTLDSKRTNLDFFERTLMAIFLVKCLQRVDFLENTSQGFYFNFYSPYLLI